MMKRFSSQLLFLQVASRISFLVWMTLFCVAETFSQDRGATKRTIARVQQKMVKLNGSGGFQGLESYQSGFLISEDGYIATVWSYVLDSEKVTVTLHDGKKLEGSLVGYDPRIDIAVIKVEADGLAHFDLNQVVEAKPGTKVLGFSNLYGVATGNEWVSVLRGVVSARTPLRARKGTFESPYKDDVLIVDAMTNNPGSPGGVVTDFDGRLTGIIGKELRDSRNNMWLNFAIPIDKISASIDAIRNGKRLSDVAAERKPTEPMTAELLGLRLVPNVVAKTPNFVDEVRTQGVAQRAGVRPDDLIVEVNGIMVSSQKEFVEAMSTIDRDSVLQMTVQRSLEFLTFELRLNR